MKSFNLFPIDNFFLLVFIKTKKIIKFVLYYSGKKSLIFSKKLPGNRNLGLNVSKYFIYGKNQESIVFIIGVAIDNCITSQKG